MIGSRSFTLQYLINIDARIEAMHVVVISAWVSSPTLSTVKPNAEFNFLLQLLNFRCTVLHQRCCGKYPALSVYISALHRSPIPCLTDKKTYSRTEGPRTLRNHAVDAHGSWKTAQHVVVRASLGSLLDYSLTNPFFHTVWTLTSRDRHGPPSRAGTRAGYFTVSRFLFVIP